MDGGNSPGRVVNRLFFFFAFDVRPPPLRTMQNVTIHGKEHEKHEEHENAKHEIQHTSGQVILRAKKKKIVDGDGKREKKVVTGPSVFICSTVAFSFHMYRVSAVDGPSVSFYFRQFLSRNLVAFAFENIHNTAFRFGSFLKTTTTHL